MNRTAVNNLVALADPQWEKDLAKLGIISNSVAADELRAEIEKQAKDRRAEAVKNAAGEILNLGGRVEERKHELVIELRNIRAREAALLKQLKEIDGAWEYGSQTLNYLPVAKMIGEVYAYDYPHLDKALFEVKELPETPAASEEKASA